MENTSPNYGDQVREIELKKLKKQKIIDLYQKLNQICIEEGHESLTQFLNEIQSTSGLSTAVTVPVSAGKPKRRVFTEEEIAKMKKLHEEGNTADQIASQLFCDEAAVKRWIAKKFIYTPLGRKRTAMTMEEMHKAIDEMFQEDGDTQSNK